MRSEVKPARVIAGQRQHGPIASVKDTIDSEAIDSVHGVRKKIFPSPAREIGLRQESRHLAADILVRGEAGELSTPGFPSARPDCWLAAVIENELRVGAFLHES